MRFAQQRDATYYYDGNQVLGVDYEKILHKGVFKEYVSVLFSIYENSNFRDKFEYQGIISFKDTKNIDKEVFKVTTYIEDGIQHNFVAFKGFALRNYQAL